MGWNKEVGRINEKLKVGIDNDLSGRISDESKN